MSYVYVISAGRNAHKIGISSNPKERLSGLQTASPTKLSLVYTIEVERPENIEARAHRILKPWRLEGEWFSIPAIGAISAIGQAIADADAGVFSEPLFVPEGEPFSGGVISSELAHAAREANAKFYREVMRKKR